MLQLRFRPSGEESEPDVGLGAPLPRIGFQAGVVFQLVTTINPQMAFAFSMCNLALGRTLVATAPAGAAIKLVRIVL